MKEIPRLIEDRIVRSLRAFPVIYIAGPRQAGKTTLVKRIASSRHSAEYITFDDIQLRSAAIEDPEAFLKSLEGPTIIDEVQMVPEIFRPLKMLVDENRKSGRFLLTGSASIMALPQLSDALVGRMVLHTLQPFSAGELQKKSLKSFIDHIFGSGRPFKLKKYKTDNRKIFFSSSFPELAKLNNDDLKHEWCNGYIDTILQRDVRSLLDINKISGIPDMLRLLAARTGGLLNEAELSRTTKLNHITAKKYRLLLESLFLTLSIPAWSSHKGKRLIKSPKIYLNDLNLLSYLLNLNSKNLSAKNPLLWGQFLENFVAVELNKQLTFSRNRAGLYHYRTSTGREIDFLLEGPEGKIVALEIKATQKVSAKDFSHIKALQKDFNKNFHCGLVLYQGKTVLPFGRNLFALPLDALWL